MSDRAYRRMAEEPSSQPNQRRTYPTSGLGQSRHVESSSASWSGTRHSQDAHVTESPSHTSERASAGRAPSHGTAREAASERRAGVPQHASSRAEGAGRYVAQRKEKAHGKVAKRVGIFVGIILAVVIGVVGWFALDVNGRLSQGLDRLRAIGAAVVHKNDVSGAGAQNHVCN